MLVPMFARRVGSKKAFIILFVVAISSTASFYFLAPSQLPLIFVINAMQHGMIWVGQAEMPPQLKELEVVSVDAINRVGSFLGLMTQSNALSPADIVPPAGDLETARIFGKRVADIAGRFSKAA